MAQADRPPAAVVAGIPVNYDEAKVGTYTLPDPLVLANGKRSATPRPGTKRAVPRCAPVRKNQYGRAPGRPAGMSFDVFDKGRRRSRAKPYAAR